MFKYDLSWVASVHAEDCVTFQGPEDMVSTYTIEFAAQGGRYAAVKMLGVIANWCQLTP
jgi:hypothetical protein